MAVLQKIRNRSALLIGAIAFALLAFIIQDVFTNGFSTVSKDVGSINGTDINAEAFRMKVANQQKNGQDASNSQVVNQIWEQEIAIALLSDQFDKLGLRAGKKHIEEIFKNDQNIGKNPQFQNELGNFDLKKFNEYVNANPEQKSYFQEREKDADLNAKYQIYSSLVKGGMYTTDAEGQLKYQMEMDKVSFDYVSVSYASVKDTDVKITDQDYIEYMKKREKRFKSEGSRVLDYVTIEDKPSAEDENSVKVRIDALVNGGIVKNENIGVNDTVPSFKTAANVRDYLSKYSEKGYDSIYKTKQELPAEFAEQLFNLPTGQTFGPYLDGNFYSVSKAMGRKSGAKAKASHILISWEGTQVPNKKEKRTKEEAKAKAESLLAQAQASPGSFMILAMTNSDDSSAQQGGDLGSFAPGQMVGPFNDFVFNNPVGKIGLVETEFGYHIINVTGKEDAVLLATLASKIEPSQATADNTYTKATKFEMDANGKDFAVVAKAAGITVNPAVTVKPMDDNFGTAGSQRQIVQWAYNDDTNIGDVKRFEIPNVGHVIAKLTKVNKKGLMSVEEVKPQLEGIIKNKKKAEFIMAKMKGTSLDAIAKANATTVQNAVDVTVDNPMLANVGIEPKVVGTAFGIGANKTSSPIEGNSGVYVVNTKSITKAPKLTKHDPYVNKLKPANASAVNRVIPALKSNADIEDNRAKFF